MTDLCTLIEHFAPSAPSQPPRLDAWRWRDVPTFDEYRARVLRAEAERAEKRRAS